MYTERNIVCPTVTKFELNRMQSLDAIVFTYIHMHTHLTHIHKHTQTRIHHRKNRISECRRPQIMQKYQNLKVEFFHDNSTFLKLYMSGN